MIQSSHSLNKENLNDDSQFSRKESNESSLNLENFDLFSQDESIQVKMDELSSKKDLTELKILGLFIQTDKNQANIAFSDLFTKLAFKQDGSKHLQSVLDHLEKFECTYIYSYVRGLKIKLSINLIVKKPVLLFAQTSIFKFLWTKALSEARFLIKKGNH